MFEEGRVSEENQSDRFASKNLESNDKVMAKTGKLKKLLHKGWLFWLAVVAIIVLAVAFFISRPKPEIKDTNPEQGTSTIDEQTEANEGFIDIHIHTMTEGMALTEVALALETSGVSKAITMQVPVDLLRYESPEKFGLPAVHEEFPVIYMMSQGEAVKLLHEVVKRGSYTVEEENRFKTLAEDTVKSGQYAGFGELALRHYSQPNLTGAQRESRDITISGDHPFMLDLADIAARYDLPLDIHIEPDSSTLPGFETLIAHNPQTKIIFDHAGWYNTGEGTAALFDRLLSKYPNLYTSIKLRRPANAIQKKVAILEQNGKINTEWLEVMKRHPDRFMIGTDIKFGLDSEEGNWEEIYSMTKKFLSALPDDLRLKIASQNAGKLFKF